MAKAVSDNLLDLNRGWDTWSGETSGVTYNANTGMLSIPASSDSVAMVTAVERYEQPLVAGTEYTLAVRASDPEMAGVLFLFDTDGAIVPVPGVTESLASVQSAAPLTFVAPQNIAGLYLQVQNRWQAEQDGALSAELTFQEEDEEEPGNGEVTELLDPAVSWTAWDGTDNNVAYDNDAQAVVIDTPEAGAGNRHGIHHYFVALTAGDTYTLSTVNAADTGASTLLFLFDGGGALVPFTNPETGASSVIAAASYEPGVAQFANNDITPDGRYVVFRGNQEDFTTQGQQFNGRGLYRWDRNTGQISEVVRVEGSDAVVYSPSISDDGNIVAYRYGSNTTGADPLYETRITDIAANRTVSESRINLKQLTGNGNALFFDDQRDGVNTPAFVPLQLNCEQ